MIPYSTTDDYIAFDNAEVAAQINKMQVLPNAITDISQLTPEQLYQIAKFAAPSHVLASSQDAIDGVIEIMNQHMVPQFYTKSDIVEREDPKKLVAVVN